MHDGVHCTVASVPLRAGMGYVGASWSWLSWSLCMGEDEDKDMQGRCHCRCCHWDEGDRGRQ